jgi:hypothetical protein
MKNTAVVTGGKPIAVESESILGISVVNLLVAFYDIHKRKGRGDVSCSGHHTNHEVHIKVFKTGIILNL